MNLTLLQLRIFSAVAEHGSVRAAARALGTAQSGITQQLQNLERTLGAPLLTRSNRGIALTAVGQRLLLRASAILNECERTEREMAQLQGEYEGKVTFGLVTEPLIDALAPVLSQFRARYERVSAHLRTGTSRMMMSWIRESSLDFAIGLVSKSTDTTDLLVTKLYPSELGIVCRRGHPKAQATSLAELADCTWIATRSPSQASEAPVNRLLGFFASHGLPQPRIIATVEGVFESMHLISQTDCLSLEAAALARHPFFAGTLASIKVKEQPAAQDVCLLQRAAVPLTPAAQELASMLASYARATHAQQR